MNYQRKLKWVFVSGILGAACWIVDHAVVAGFDVNQADYPCSYKTYADQVNAGFATLILEGARNRLISGALIATMIDALFPMSFDVYQYF